jgi:hypothetical protein
MDPLDPCLLVTTVVIAVAVETDIKFINTSTNGKDKIQARFLELFEKAALANSWNGQLRLTQVGCYLEGAQIWLTTITRANHNTVKWFSLVC